MLSENLPLLSYLPFKCFCRNDVVSRANLMAVTVNTGTMVTNTEAHTKHLGLHSFERFYGAPG